MSLPRYVQIEAQSYVNRYRSIKEQKQMLQTQRQRNAKNVLTMKHNLQDTLDRMRVMNKWSDLDDLDLG